MGIIKGSDFSFFFLNTYEVQNIEDLKLLLYTQYFWYESKELTLYLLGHR